MEVILLHDVDNVGHEGDLVKVADGFARNYLMPRKLATVATRGAKKELQQRERAIARRAMEKGSAASDAAQRLEQQPITIPAHVGEGGRLHGQITSQVIAAAIAEQFGLELTRRDIEITEPIRQTGDHFVRATLYKGVHAQVALTVVPERVEEEWSDPDVAATAPEAELEAETDEAAESTEEADGSVAEEALEQD